MRYINAITITNKREREDYALNSAIFAFKFGGNYSLVKSDTNSLQTRLGGHVDVNKVGNLAASINYELEKSVHRTFENKFSKLWIIGFGTDDRLESLTFKK